MSRRCLWCDDSKQKRPGTQLMCITIHLQHTGFFFHALMHITHSAHMATHENSCRLVKLHTMLRHNASVQTLKWLLACLTSQQHISVSQGRICSDNFMCCHTEIEVADPTFYLTHSQYTDTGPTSPSAHPIMPEAWHGSHWSANF